MNKGGEIRPKQKKRSRASASTFVIFTWLGYLSQTFEDLESVKDKLSDIKAIQKILNERTL